VAVRRGWTPQAFETWIAEAIADLLLAERAIFTWP
jgi:hypothetical protein